MQEKKHARYFTAKGSTEQSSLPLRKDLYRMFAQHGITMENLTHFFTPARDTPGFWKTDKKTALAPDFQHDHRSKPKQPFIMSTLTRFKNRHRPAAGGTYLDRFFRTDPFELWDSGNQVLNTVPSINITEEDKNFKVEM